MALILSLSAIIIPTLKVALVRAQVGAMAAEGRTVHTAFKKFFVDQSMYPNAVTNPAFNLATFEPLVSAGYYDGRVTERLLGDQADGYDSPADTGQNQEFWLEMTLKADPTIRFLVVDSDNSLLGAGTHYDGVYMFSNGVLTPLGTPIK
jgi:hypothetical protein